MGENESTKRGLAAGWMLVSGLLLFCVVGTWLTAHNYKQKVFSSAQGVVLENQWPEIRISVKLPLDEARKVLPSHHALVTVGTDTHPLQGLVVSVSPGGADAMVIVRLLKVSGDASSPQRTLPVGARCSVTIDTTIPPQDEGSRESLPGALK
jgi:hypothetical protein